MNHPSTRLREALCVGMLCLLGAACVPLFQSPLPASPDLRPDAQLLGTWAGVSNGNDEEAGGVQVSFFPRNSGWMDVIYVSDADGTSASCDVLRYEAYTTDIEDDRFLCLRGAAGAGSNEETNAFMIATYRLESPDRLAVTLFSQDKVKALIGGDKLQGDVTHAQYADTVMVTSTPTRLAAAILAEGVDAFIATNEVMRFVRLRPAVDAAERTP